MSLFIYFFLFTVFLFIYWLVIIHSLFIVYFFIYLFIFILVRVCLHVLYHIYMHVIFGVHSISQLSHRGDQVQVSKRLKRI